jgi:hypothetical protein
MLVCMRMWKLCDVFVSRMVGVGVGGPKAGGGDQM